MFQNMLLAVPGTSLVLHVWRHAMAMLFVDCLLALWKHGWKGHKAWLSVASATACPVGHRCFLARGGSRPRMTAETELDTLQNKIDALFKTIRGLSSSPSSGSLLLSCQHTFPDRTRLKVQ